MGRVRARELEREMMVLSRSKNAASIEGHGRAHIGPGRKIARTEKKLAVRTEFRVCGLDTGVPCLRGADRFILPPCALSEAPPHPPGGALSFFRWFAPVWMSL